MVADQVKFYSWYALQSLTEELNHETELHVHGELLAEDSLSILLFFF